MILCVSAIDKDYIRRKRHTMLEHMCQVGTSDVPTVVLSYGGVLRLVYDKIPLYKMLF